MEETEKDTSSQETMGLLKHWNRSGRKERFYPLLGPGYAAGFQFLVCINQSVA